MIDFLELTPKPATETVTLETADGNVELEFTGLTLSTLSDLAKRYPSFGSIIEGNTSASMINAADAMPALIAAGLGHHGAEEYEAKAREFSAADMMLMVSAVMRLTMPQRSETGPLANGADAAQPATLPPPLNS